MAKKYFWLKLKDDFFNQKEIKMLRKIAGGDTYTVIYLKMLLLSLKDEGKIYYDGIAGNFIDEIALTIDEEIENTQVTFNYLQQKGLIEFIQDDQIELTNIASMIGSETDKASMMRRKRARDKLENSNNVTKALPDRYTEIEIEKEIEKEIDKEIDKKNKSQSPRRYGDDSPYLKMAQYLFNWIKQNNPSAKEPNYQKWADDFRKLSEIDKRSKKDIKQIIDWSQKDNFWQTNILSPAKLRKHFDKLTMQKNAKPSNRNSYQEVAPSWLNQEKTGLQEVKEEKTHNNTIEEIEAEFDDVSADIQARINRLYGDDDN